MVNESNKTIFKSLFINLALSPVTTMKNLDFSVILQQRRLCSFKNQCHKHVLFNVCTAIVTFLCRKNTLQHLEHPSLKVSDDFRWSSIKIVIVSQRFCLILFSRFLQNHPSDCFETLLTYKQSPCTCLIVNNFDLEQ